MVLYDSPLKFSAAAAGLTGSFFDDFLKSLRLQDIIYIFDPVDYG